MPLGYIPGTKKAKTKTKPLGWGSHHNPLSCYLQDLGEVIDVICLKLPQRIDTEIKGIKCLMPLKQSDKQGRMR